MIILIGESGSGKDTVADMLHERGYKKILSHTTRPRREGEGETYIFSTIDEYQAKVPFESTTFGGNYYWTEYEDFDDPHSVIIVDAVGAVTLKNHFPDAIIIYLKCPRWIRLSRVGIMRVDRDDGKFDWFPCSFVVDVNCEKEEMFDRVMACL